MAKLVQKISSIVARTGDVFRRRKLSMNEAAARKYQKLIFEKRMAEDNSIRTPTYKKIAEQLDNRSDQVFESAVYHLSKIAVSAVRYRSEIKAILNEYAQNPALSAKRKEYLDRKIAEIK
uniref:Uncharacterized protein n=1 Tax=uncultured Alphaproteobacteria bacterium TaxID=91750 RepID=A0A6G8F224_9PROT|nr:hypothetical protein PlAlph_1390 [uncultured Alphaproteobacteria bacterium]